MRVFRDFDILPRFERAVATVGSFDGVHRGHQLVLEKLRASMRGGLSVVAEDGFSAAAGFPAAAESVVITFSPHPREVLGGALRLDGVPEGHMPLLTTQPEKEALLARAGVDNLVVMPFTRELAGHTAAEFAVMLAGMGIVRFVAGFNQCFGRDRMPARELAVGVALRRVAVLGDFSVDVGEELANVHASSTTIRRLIASGNLCAAAELLGYDYFVMGQWKELDINDKGVVIAEFTPHLPNKLLPPDGDYATSEGAVIIRGGRIFAALPHETRGKIARKMIFM